MPAPKDFPEMWAWLQREVKKAKEGSAFSGTGVHPNGQQGLDSDNYVPDTAGFSLNGATGTPEFNDLKLRGGIIGNDALTNPLEKKRIRNSATNYAVPSGSFTQVCSVNATVPDGFTGVMAIANGYNFVRNTNTTGGSNGAGGNLVYTLVGFGGLFTDAEGWPLSGGGGFTGSGVSDTFDITGLTGGDVLTLSLLVGVGYDTIPADSLTRGFVSAGLFWFR